MIYLVTGLPGNGKTYFTVAKGAQLLEAPGRQIHQHGIPELKNGWIPFDGEVWYTMPEGSAIVIDEAQTVFRPMPPGAERPRKVRELETHRHKGWDVWLITQHPALLDSHVRRLVQKHYHLYRAFGLGGSTVLEWEECQEKPMDYHSKKLAIKSRISFKREVWEKYRSATLHTVKRRLPFKLFLLPIALVAALGLAWFGYHHLRHSAEVKSGKVVDGNGKPLVPAAAAPVGPAVRHQQRVVERLQSTQPDIEGLPHTAARYDALTKPKAVPVVRACFEDMRFVPAPCTCVSQRGTRISTTRDFCERFIAGDTPFYDFEPDEQPQMQDVRRVGFTSETGSVPETAADPRVGRAAPSPLESLASGGRDTPAR